ncbi:MAG: hypothetical protein JWM98_3418 [Thermoleophilia bacterium]|nr:hypothetical protein [Thermoleophilia bacterium]
MWIDSSGRSAGRVDGYWSGVDGADAVAVVERWQGALARRDVEAAIALGAEDIRLEDGDVAREGADEVGAWIGETGLVTETLRWFARGDRVVVDQLDTWLPRDLTKELPRAAVRGATSYVVHAGLISRIERFATIEAAFAAAGLDAEADAVDDPRKRV